MDRTIWENAVSNAFAQKTNQDLRYVLYVLSMTLSVMNLELLNRFGANAFTVQNDEYEALTNTLRKRVQELERLCEAVNQRRKTAQVC